MPSNTSSERVTGRKLTEKWGVRAKHALYREDGSWYHQLKAFPGVLFDRNGYIVFETEEDYRNSPHLQIRKDIHVPGSIASLPGYIRVVSEEGLFGSEESADRSIRWEGGARSVRLTRYERDPKARAACIAHYGPRCQCCKLDFGEMYGEVADGLIHVHHLTPLSQIRREYSVDPVRDLRPVCPNCHAVIHLRKHPYTVEEVWAMLKARIRSTRARS